MPFSVFIIIVEQPTDLIAPKGENAKAKVIAEGENLTYQWYHQLMNSSSWVESGYTGAQTAEITVPVINSTLTRKYKCVITASNGITLETDIISVAIGESQSLPSIKSQPSDCEVEDGETAVFKVVAEGDNLTYAWQTKISPTSDWITTRLPGYSTDTLRVNYNESYIGRQFRCIVTDGNGNSVISENAILLEKMVVDLYKITYDANFGYFIFNSESFAEDCCTVGTYYTINGEFTNEVAVPVTTLLAGSIMAA